MKQHPVKKLFLFCCLLFSLHLSAQQQESVLLDSCLYRIQSIESLAGKLVPRPQHTASWNQPNISMNRFFEQLFTPYLQKTAGGTLTLNLLIDNTGRCCLYKVLPNSNVRPDFVYLKKQLDQTNWIPARHFESPVYVLKTLRIGFKGKKVQVTELD